MLKPGELVVDSSLRTKEHHLNTSMKTSWWCHPVYKGVTHRVVWNFRKTPIFSALSRTIFGKLSPIMCKNKDNFASKNTLFFQLKDTFQKFPLFLKKSDENLRPLWHKNVHYFFIPWTLSSERPPFLDFTSKKPYFWISGTFNVCRQSWK